MRYRLITVLIISFCVSSFHVLAQEQIAVLPENAIELLNKINQNENSSNLNYSYTEQHGNENNIDIFSTQNGLVKMNIVNVGQYGNGNSGIVNQYGQDQEISIFQQGRLNYANLSVSGNNVYNVVTQVGNENYVKQDIENSNSISAILKTVSTEQYGNENEIILKSSPLDYSAIEITQHGNKNSVNVDLTDALISNDPYKIDQFGNEGEVSITKSTFYMPMKSYDAK